MTARERALWTAVIETISVRPACSKPYRTASLAASVA
jgi:hypothetical protein